MESPDRKRRYVVDRAVRAQATYELERPVKSEQEAVDLGIGCDGRIGPIR